jgi:hypothetical protein
VYKRKRGRGRKRERERERERKREREGGREKEGEGEKERERERERERESFITDLSQPCPECGQEVLKPPKEEHSDAEDTGEGERYHHDDGARIHSSC